MKKRKKAMKEACAEYFEYKGYKGTIEYSAEDGCLFGKVLNAGNDLILYQGLDLNELRADFESAVDGMIIY